MDNETVPLKYLHSILRVAAEQGFDVDAIVKSLDISNEQLNSNNALAVIDAELYNTVFIRIMWLLQDESFGLSLKQKSPLGTFRMMCYSIIHCQNLEKAINRAAEFTNFCQSLSGSTKYHSKPINRLADKTAEYLLPETDQFGFEHYQQAHNIAHCMLIWRRFCSWLIGKNIELIEVNFQLPAPKQSQYLQRILDCKINYEQAENSFIFPSHYLQAPLVHTEESLQEFLKNAPYQLLASNEADEGSIIAKMRRIIGNDFSRDFPSVVDMSSEMNMSVRTLRRRLKDVGTTYQQFKDGLRRDAAMAYLNRPDLKINAVSALLGFDEPSAFHRSFKKWTGLTPGEYRQSQLDQQ